MFFKTSSLDAIAAWIICIFVTSVAAYYYLSEREQPTGIKLKGTLCRGVAIFFQVIVIAFICYNWCNIACLTLVSCIFAIFCIFLKRRHIVNSDDLVLPASIAVVFALIGAALMVSYTQHWSVADLRSEDHRLTTYQINDQYDYDTASGVVHTQTITYICEDGFTGTLDLNGDPHVYIYFDADNPRVSDITITQDRIEDTIFSGPTKLYSTNLEEVVIYLPDTSQLRVSPSPLDE